MQRCRVSSVGQLNTAGDAAFQYAPIRRGAQSDTHCGVHCHLYSTQHAEMQSSIQFDCILVDAGRIGRRY